MYVKYLFYTCYTCEIFVLYMLNLSIESVNVADRTPV